MLEYGDATNEVAGSHEPERRLLTFRIDPRQLHQARADLKELARRIPLVEEGRPFCKLTMRGRIQQGVGWFAF